MAATSPRRSWALALAAACLLASAPGGAEAEESVLVYVGSAGCDGEDKGCKDQPAAEQQVIRGVEVFADGRLVPWPGLAVDTEGMPAWMTWAPAKKGRAAGCGFVTRPDKEDILALAPSRGAWMLTPGSATASGGHNPVECSVTEDGNYLLVANYNGPDDATSSKGASVASFSISEGCRLTLADSKPHAGSSVNRARQGAAHVHSVLPARRGLAYACDLGMDVVFTYRVESDGKLTELSRTKTAPGLGPRHLVQHPTLPVIYVVCEMGQAVLAFREEEGGALTLLQTSSLLPDGARGEGSKAAEIAILPDGSALYATNRGAVNTVTTFTISGEDGTLTRAQQIDAPAYPRGMTLALDGAVLLVAGQSKTSLVSYLIQADGTLQASGHTLTSGLPPNPAAFMVLPDEAPAESDEM